MAEAEALLAALGDRAAVCRVMLRRARVMRGRGDAQGLATALAAADRELSTLPIEALAPLRSVREALDPIDGPR